MELNGLDVRSPAPFAKGKTLGEVLLTPTRIYVKSCLKAIRKYPGSIRALAHITGGGVENIPRVLPPKLAVSLQAGAWPSQPVFRWLQQAGNIPPEDMRRTFNCGIGMVMVVSASSAPAVTRFLEKEGEKVYRLGEVVARVKEAVVMHG
jgi:phosphoribosylformylglycinamidine cyclo-ligase